MSSRSAPRGAASLSPPRRAVAVATALVLVVLLSLVLGPGTDGAGAQGATSTTTRPASTSSSVAPSTSAVATTAAPTTASTAAPTTTVVETTTTASTTTTVAATSTLPPPPPVENARFPARLVAPVPPVEGGPELVINAMYLAASEDGQAPDVVVHFRAPFTLPSSKYQVALFVGDPNGQRARFSFVSTGPNATPTGTVDVGDGTTWTTSGPTQVRHDASGFVVIRVPLAATPAGGAVWTEITEGAASAPTVRTPFFDRTAFFGTADAGTLPASGFGRVTTPDGKAVAEVAPLDAGPVLTVNQQKIYVKYSDAPPTALLGQPVKEVVDSVRIVPNFDTGGVVGDSIRINRTEGTAALLDGFGASPVDKSGDRAWVVRGPDGSPGPTTLVFDLDAAAQALDIPVAADRTAVGLTRSFVLADGRVVTADGVLATNAWLDLAPPPLSAAPSATAPAPGTASVIPEERRPLLIGAAVAGAVLLVLLGIVLVRRRRRRKEDAAVTAAMASRAQVGDRIPWARNDSQLTQELDRVVVPGTAENSLLPASGEVPVVSAATLGATVVGTGPTPATSVTPDGVDAEPPPSVGHAGPVPWRSGQAGQVPAVATASDIPNDTASDLTAGTTEGASVGTAGAATASATTMGAAAGLVDTGAGAGASATDATVGEAATTGAVATGGAAAAGAPDVVGETTDLAAAAPAAAAVASPAEVAGPAAAPDEDRARELVVATGVTSTLGAQGFVPATAEAEHVPVPGAESGAAAQAAGSAAAVPAAAVDRRRRRASGVVIAGPTVGDVVAPSARRSGSVAPTPSSEARSTAPAVVWASEAPAAALHGSPEPEADPGVGREPDHSPESEREVSGDSDQIDPSDALAALDLDLGSFRSRFDPDGS